MINIEQKVNYQLNKNPKLKKVIKRIYQRTMCFLIPQKTSQGNIIRVSPNEKGEFFFGYYDKSPFDISNRYLLCMKAKDTWSNVAPNDSINLILIDTVNKTNTTFAKSNAWNVQQGCMLQWLGPDYSERVIYNDFRNNEFCSIIYNLKTSREEKVLKMPVYSVSQDGATALTLDFTRLHRLRKGYGYSNKEERTRDLKIPNTPCIWKINLITGETKPLLKYSDLVHFEPRPEMKNAEHKVNHIMISPDGNRFMFLHRWINNSRKYSRLLTADIDGSNLYNLSDDDMVSHCCWKNEKEILAFENKRKTGPGYYLMEDQSQNFSQFWPELQEDGHPSYSPNGEFVVTDTYPNRSRMASIKLLSKTQIKVIAKVFAPFKYDNDTRCDLHPRWSRDGQKIIFDSIFDGKRGLYLVEL